jgi:hypothetical protein
VPPSTACPGGGGEVGTLSYRGIARTFAEVLSLVATGENVFPTGESFPNYYGHPDVRFVPMHGWPPVTRILLWRRGTDGKAAAFARLAAPGTGPSSSRCRWPPRWLRQRHTTCLE